MLFNSLDFLFFLPVVVALFYLLPSKARTIFLLLASYYFYASWNVNYAGLMLFSTVVTYLSGFLIYKAKERRLKRLYLFLSLTLNLAILFYFKYFNFLSESFQFVFNSISLDVQMPFHRYILPVGISFYTFQALSYSIDVYNNKIKVEKNFIKYALFVSFFPQLVAGPIEKSKDLLTQLQFPKKITVLNFKTGLLIILWGLFKKIVIADRLAIFVNKVYDSPQDHDGITLIIATLFFSIQIYCDFSGYSDIAIGVSKLFGINLSTNFKAPYFSKNIPEFWRRWHITLGAWFKEYLYIPLGGNKSSKNRVFINIMIVFLVSGIWHGASWNFFIWGFLHGTYMILYVVLKPIRNKFVSFFNINRISLGHKIMTIVITFSLVNVAWVFFRANTFSDVLIIFNSIFDINLWALFSGELLELGLNNFQFLIVVCMIILMMIVEWVNEKNNILTILYNQSLVFRWFIYYTLIIIILLFGVYGDYTPSEFIYFQF